jgi:hypothetical protein
MQAASNNPVVDPDERALQLLLSVLSEHEKKQFAKDGYLKVTPRWWHRYGYKIYLVGGKYGRVRVKRYARWGFYPAGQNACVSLLTRIPNADQILAYYLAIKARPTLFRVRCGWLYG